MALILKHQTIEQFLTRFKRRFENADHMQQAKLSVWLDEKQSSGDIAAKQIESAFSLSTAGKDSFMQKVKALSDSYKAVQAGVK